MKRLTLCCSTLLSLCLALISLPSYGGFISNGAIESDGTNATLDHTYFRVNTAGVINIALSSTDDPEMNLRNANANGTLGSFIENDDDDGPGLNAFISRFLAEGIYAIINGEFSVANTETGFVHLNGEAPSNPYTLSVSGDTSLLFVREGNLRGGFTQRGGTVPEPETLLLFALGLLGLGLRHRAT